MLNLRQYNKICYLIIMYGFFKLFICVVRVCVTYVCGARVVSAFYFFVPCRVCSYIACVENIRILWFREVIDFFQ